MSIDREILEGAVRAIGERASEADGLVHEALEAGFDGSAPLTLHAKILRQELINTKSALERELGRLLLDCTACGQRVHWIAGLGATAGHWAHRDPAPHGEPTV